MPTFFFQHLGRVISVSVSPVDEAGISKSYEEMLQRAKSLFWEMYHVKNKEPIKFEAS